MKALSFSDYKKLKELSYNQLNIWLLNFYHAAYEDGREKALENASVIDSEELYSLMTSAGISSDTANDVIGRVTDDNP